jgi:hypothetical protein
MAVRFVRPYRFSSPQQVQMADTGIVAPAGATFVDGVPYAAVSAAALDGLHVPVNVLFRPG